MDGLLGDMIATWAGTALPPVLAGLACALAACAPAMLCAARRLHVRAAFAACATVPALTLGPWVTCVTWAALAVLATLPPRRDRVRVPRDGSRVAGGATP